MRKLAAPQPCGVLAGTAAQPVPSQYWVKAFEPLVNPIDA